MTTVPFSAIRSICQSNAAFIGPPSLLISAPKNSFVLVVAPPTGQFNTLATRLGSGASSGVNESVYQPVSQSSAVSFAVIIMK